MRQADTGVLSCSFCRKSQDSVAKLISNPGDYPRAYICKARRQLSRFGTVRRLPSRRIWPLSFPKEAARMVGAEALPGN